MQYLPLHVQVDSFLPLGDTFRKQPPPSLKETIWDYGMEESGKLVYRRTGFDHNFFELLFRLLEEPDQVDQFLFHLDTEPSLLGRR